MAANQGLGPRAARDVVLLNNDTRVRPGWLEALLRARGETPRAGVVCPKVLNLDGTVQAAGGVLHTSDGGFALPHAGEDRLAPPVCARREVHNAGGPCMLLTRELLERLGGLDEAYSPAYFEDTDLCLRAREAGFVLVYEPAAEVYHHGQATSKLVQREGRVDVWGGFEANRRRFHGRWNPRLAADEAARREPPDRRLVVLLCYHSSVTTTAAFLERALRREHDVVTAGRGQDLDLGASATAADLVEAAGRLVGRRVDLLLVVEGETYLPRAVDDAPCATALWAIDTHLHAEAHLTLGASFDHLLLAQPDYLPRFRARGLDPVWLPLACDPEAHSRAPAEAPRDLDLVFVGHVRPFHARRRRVLDRLAARFRLTERQGVFGEDMARLFARAKVVVNCSLSGDLNMRVFEGLASGALVLTDRIDNGLPGFFADGEHLALYGERDLEAVADRYLSDAARRVAVAARGQRLAARHHTYADRARELVRAVTTRRPRRGARGPALEARA
ncbi:MAG: glycosyltransferase [Planctomycetota bacterium]|nr:glycosyltransferase [Planctomycetota bacterium]